LERRGKVLREPLKRAHLRNTLDDDIGILLEFQAYRRMLPGCTPSRKIVPRGFFLNRRWSVVFLYSDDGYGIAKRIPTDLQPDSC